jgi:o-succinylbenzoate---CoA ligase
MITISNNRFWLIEQAEKHPDQCAVASLHESLTYKELSDKSIRAAGYFWALGIAKGNNVGLFADHTFEFWITVNALWIIGAVPVPLNTRNTSAEIESQIKHAEIKFLIGCLAANDEKSSIEEKFTSLNFQNKFLFNIIQSHNSDSTTNHSAISILHSEFCIHNSALILFTSGSSGRLKAVVHTFSSLFENVCALDSFSELTANDKWLASLPLYHIGGFMILVRALISGSCVTFPVSLKYDEIKISLEHFNPTHVSFVPTTLHLLFKENVKPNDRLKYVFLGGGKAGAKLCLGAANSGWPIVKVYGSTETCSMVTALSIDELKLRPNSSGKPMGQSKIKILSKSKIRNKIMSKNEDAADGEILVHSKCLFKEYYNDAATTNARLMDNWYYTGDYGRLDDEDYLYVETRKDDLIITGGENVNPNEVENAIRSIPKVTDVFVFALDDEKWGQIICAAVAAEEILEDDLRNALKPILAGYKIPKKFFFVNEIPRNEMGKIKRTELLSILKLDLI